MPGPQLDQTAMAPGGSPRTGQIEAGLRDALSNKMGTNARNSMFIPEGSAEISISGGRRGFLGFKKGGIVPGKGSKDSVKAKLTPGEMVVPKKKVPKVKAAIKAYTPLRPKKGRSGLMEG